MPNPRRRTRPGFARNALTLAIAAAGAGLIAFGAFAQEVPEPCYGPDCLGADPAPPVDPDGAILPRTCACAPLYACAITPMTCWFNQIKLCCPTLGCVRTTPGAPLPPGC